MTTNGNTLRWGIIGPGAIAKDFRRGVLDSQYGTLEAIASPGCRKLAWIAGRWIVGRAASSLQIFTSGRDDHPRPQQGQGD